jgi:hypothetical protein
MMLKLRGKFHKCIGKGRTTMASVSFKISAKLHDVRTHKMEVFIVTTLRNSNFAWNIDIFEGHN